MLIQCFAYSGDRILLGFIMTQQNWSCLRILNVNGQSFGLISYWMVFSMVIMYRYTHHPLTTFMCFHWCDSSIKEISWAKMHFVHVSLCIYLCLGYFVCHCIYQQKNFWNMAFSVAFLWIYGVFFHLQINSDWCAASKLVLVQPSVVT